MTTKSKKKEVTFLQTQNPRTKQWIKINAKTGKIISTKKTPGKYKGIKIAKLAKPKTKVKDDPIGRLYKEIKKDVAKSKAAFPAKGNDNGRVKKAAQNAKRAASSPKKKTVAKPRVKISEQTKADIKA